MTRTELSEAIAIAFDALRANPLRSVLATLGITIGVSFVALMGWFLAGLDSSLQHTINMLGEDMLYVDKWDWSGRTSWVEVSNRKPISYRQAQELADAVRTAQYAMPMGQTRAQLSVGSRKAESIPVAGVPHDYGNTPAGAVTRGRFFTEMEGRSGAPVAVLGPVIAKQLFPQRGSGWQGDSHRRAALYGHRGGTAAGHAAVGLRRPVGAYPLGALPPALR
jgi:putative ABC transport system permease protein